MQQRNQLNISLPASLTVPARHWPDLIIFACLLKAAQGERHPAGAENCKTKTIVIPYKMQFGQNILSSNSNQYLECFMKFIPMHVPIVILIIPKIMYETNSCFPRLKQFKQHYVIQCCDQLLQRWITNIEISSNKIRINEEAFFFQELKHSFDE